MACTSLTALPRACGAEGVMGGLASKLYIIAYSDLAPASGVAGTPIYTTAANGMISDIGLATSKTFVEVGLLKNTAGLNETFQADATKGLAYFNQSLTIVLSGLTVENRAFVKSLISNPVAVLIQTRNGNYYTTGLNGLFELSAGEGGTGVAEGDLNGYTLTLSGLDTEPVRMVDPTIVSGLIA